MFKRSRRRAAVVALAFALGGAASQAVAQPTSTPAASAPRDQIARGLKETAVFAVLETYYPALFNATIDTVVDGMSKGRSMRDMQASIRAEYVKLLGQQLPKADAILVQRGVKIMRDQAEALSSSPEECMAVLGYVPYPRMAQQVIPANLIKAEQDWAAEVLRQTAEKPVVRTIGPLQEKVIQELAFSAYDAMSTDDRRLRIARLGGAFRGVTDVSDQGAICEFGLHFFDEIVQRPALESAEVFLSLSAQP